MGAVLDVRGVVVAFEVTMDMRLPRDLAHLIGRDRLVMMIDLRYIDIAYKEY